MKEIAERLKALSDPTRLRVLNLLEHGELCVCDLMAVLELPQPKVSRHMAFLKRTEWVTSRRCGKWIYYSLAAPENPVQGSVLSALRQAMPQVPQATEDHEQLCRHLKTKNTGSCG
ncbi:Transcriptional regulator, ArsR family [Pseudodesulfovibrio profundus]|uniref:Transcriptional regulator, ArsR family n=1 Tax=Pseudodesulfovibrio profundus TaxID=57320 RepID=A0A2C8FBD4_9BACT|nr:metalloregulator ArsR/SmtB family transcription factor [Pseudodesulfovibrio profundus]MBC15668.1 transcriptional regulator [Desulfovibrio sp.]SOB59747.1 Transcriptional regulator, ArsR family [Pseudodesulfovibrio profundus]|tara:strand:- start:45042 stop:45389 length:348 start_codon:yes stop_codon:yes gene_type:complete